MGKVPRVLEKHVVKKIRTFLDEQPGVYYFIKEAKSLRGIPDIIISWHGTFVALEVKRDESEVKKKGAKLQAYTINEIRKSGGLAFFIYPQNLEDVLTTISKTLYHKRSYYA